MEPPRLIKRYQNRKLYDTKESRYVTLDDLATLVRAGTEIRILDNSSGRDLTSVTLAQIILEEEKRRRGVPLSALRTLIQEGSASLGELVTQIGRDIDQTVQTVGRVLGRSETQGCDREDTSQQQSQHGGGGDLVGTLSSIRDWLTHSQRSIEEWQGRVDEQIRRLAESLSPMLRLQRQMAELEARVGELENRIGPNSKEKTEAQ